MTRLVLLLPITTTLCLVRLLSVCFRRLRLGDCMVRLVFLLIRSHVILIILCGCLQLLLAEPLHPVFVRVEHAMLDHQLGVVLCLARLLSALAQPDTRLQLVVVHGIRSHDQEVVLLVTLGRLALHSPVVLAEHLVVVLFVLLVQHLVGLVPATLLHCLLGWQEVGDELFATLVHHSADHGLRHLFHLGL